MSRFVPIGFGLLLVVAAGWLVVTWPRLAELARHAELTSLLALSLLYVGSHLLRMARLALLTLDTRSRALPAMVAHALTAFPSSFLPYKLGEVLRLGAFSHVYGGFRRALAVWLAERFGDVLVISAFIFGLYLLDVNVPEAMRLVFIVFVVASTLGLLALFAVSTVFVYLNRRLVLTSHSRRGLLLLRANHALRELEADIRRSVQGRFSGVMFLSLLIWGIEVLTLSLFLRMQSVGSADHLAMLFVPGLLASLPGGRVAGAEGFGLYQSLGVLLVCLAALVLASVRSLSGRRKLA